MALNDVLADEESLWFGWSGKIAAPQEECLTIKCRISRNVVYSLVDLSERDLPVEY